ncbi:MAG: Crp/Fnr family transcriptional regulator [Bacteroidota bacterium]
MDKTDFRAYINTKTHINDREWQLIDKLFKPLEVKKNDYLLIEGTICNHAYFLSEGLIRFFYWTDDGEDITKHLTFPKQYFTSSESFGPRQPSTENIQIIEDALVYQIHYDTLQEIYANVPSWSIFVRKIVQEVQADVEARMRSLITESAEDRYLKLIAKYPDYAPQIPLQYMATYLGMKPQSLSRVRKKLADQRRS